MMKLYISCSQNSHNVEETDTLCSDKKHQDNDTDILDPHRISTQMKLVHSRVDVHKTTQFKLIFVPNGGLFYMSYDTLVLRYDTLCISHHIFTLSLFEI